ncbi:MAG: hypothetical protein A3F11_10190 [Gammaproteobacteria bacterium RIFCSPHIGHO2_12_FULL_37_14]|nr:MAG: hypothetical protein A3F11_10190 [Gammaproteobacteria bacterium RIFCSPHIGHO2_12_FULL_37_14]
MKFGNYFLFPFNFILVFLLIFPVTVNAAHSLKKPEKIIKHQEILTLPDQRKILIQLISINKSPDSLLDLNGTSQVIIKDNKNHLLGSIKFDTPNVSFKIYTIQGLPTPLILFAAIDSIGTSAGFYSIYPYAIVNNRIKLLQLNRNKWKLETYSGGFYIGKLPHQEDMGAVFWTCVWGNNEAHIDPHRYAIELYRWNGTVFILSKKWITKDKYSNDEDALKAYGLVKQDLSLDFSNINATH